MQCESLPHIALKHVLLAACYCFVLRLGACMALVHYLAESMHMLVPCTQEALLLCMRHLIEVCLFSQEALTGHCWCLFIQVAKGMPSLDFNAYCTHNTFLQLL